MMTAVAFIPALQAAEPESRPLERTVFTGVPFNKMKKKVGGMNVSTGDLKIQHFFARRK